MGTGQHQALRGALNGGGDPGAVPTLGTARHASALSVQTFCKKTSIIAASAAFTRAGAASIARLARLEGLEAHARAVELRGRS